MNITVLSIVLLILMLFLCKNKYEKFTLNFPKNKKLKCKCDLDNQQINEEFTEYDNKAKKLPNQLDRIYNIYKAVNDVSAESYYENKYSYPILPIKNGKKKVIAANSVDYENIGLNTQKILPKEYKNGFLSSHKYNFGLKYQP